MPLCDGAAGGSGVPPCDIAGGVVPLGNGGVGGGVPPCNTAGGAVPCCIGICGGVLPCNIKAGMVPLCGHVCSGMLPCDSKGSGGAGAGEGGIVAAPAFATASAAATTALAAVFVAWSRGANAAGASALAVGNQDGGAGVGAARVPCGGAVEAKARCAGTNEHGLDPRPSHLQNCVLSTAGAAVFSDCVTGSWASVACGNIRKVPRTRQHNLDKLERQNRTGWARRPAPVQGKELTRMALNVAPFCTVSHH